MQESVLVKPELKSHHRIEPERASHHGRDMSADVALEVVDRYAQRLGGLLLVQREAWHRLS